MKFILFLIGKNFSKQPTLIFDDLIYENLLVIITHETFCQFDCNPSLEVRSIFLDILQASNKVLHEGLYKLTSFSISGNLINLIKHYLNDRFRKVFLSVNVQTVSLFLHEFLKDPFWDICLYHIYILITSWMKPDG